MEYRLGTVFSLTLHQADKSKSYFQGSRELFENDLFGPPGFGKSKYLRKKPSGSSPELVNYAKLYSDRLSMRFWRQRLLLTLDPCPADLDFDLSPVRISKNKNYRYFWMHLNAPDPGGIFHRASVLGEKAAQLIHGPIK